MKNQKFYFSFSQTLEVKLAALDLNDGKAESIANSISNVIEEYNLWGSFSMIVPDTSIVNTGKPSGVVVRLNKEC